MPQLVANEDTEVSKCFIYMQTVFSGADISPPRTAPKSMPMHINNVHCTGEEINLLDCSYSRNHTDADRSKDFEIQCRKGRLLQAHSIMYRLMIDDYEGYTGTME